MNREKAIKILRMNDQAKWRSGVSVEEENEAVNMAIRALKEETICPILSDDEVKQPCIKSPCGIERSHGEWIYHAEWYSDGECAYECSKCGMGAYVGYNYCPRCGADMRKEGGDS